MRPAYVWRAGGSPLNTTYLEAAKEKIPTIPLLFLNAGLVSLSRSVVNILEEQSTRLLAVRLETATH